MEFLDREEADSVLRYPEPGVSVSVNFLLTAENVGGSKMLAVLSQS